MAQDTEKAGSGKDPAVTPLKPETQLHELTRQEQKAIGEHGRPNAALIHETIRADAEAELNRQSGALFLSGLAAGASIGLSLLCQAILQHHLPDTAWRGLVSSLGYTVGFVVVILGRQQLFTENTLSPILPLLNRPDLSMGLNVARLWGLVLAANLLGGFVFAWAISLPGLTEPGLKETIAEVSRHALEPEPFALFLKAIVAGWLIALTLWLLPASTGSGISVIVLLTYVISAGKFAHVVAGAVEVFYLVQTGEAGWSDFLVHFFLPVLSGNIVGGVALVALLAYGQVASDLK